MRERIGRNGAGAGGSCSMPWTVLLEWKFLPGLGADSDRAPVSSSGSSRLATRR
jgi:hypothetical protein